MCVQCLYGPSYFGKSIHCLQGGPSAPGGHIEVCGCHSPFSGTSLGVSPRGWWRVQGRVGAQVAAPGPLLWEVSQCFSGHQVCAAASCLPWGPSASSFSEVSWRLTLNTGLCLISNFGAHYLYICPHPDSLTKLNLDIEWFWRAQQPKIVSFVWSMCSFPSLIFFPLLVYVMLLAC